MFSRTPAPWTAIFVLAAASLAFWTLSCLTVTTTRGKETNRIRSTAWRITNYIPAIDERA